MLVCVNGHRWDSGTYCAECGALLHPEPVYKLCPICQTWQLDTCQFCMCCGHELIHNDPVPVMTYEGPPFEMTKEAKEWHAKQAQMVNAHTPYAYQNNGTQSKQVFSNQSVSGYGNQAPVRPKMKFRDYVSTPILILASVLGLLFSIFIAASTLDSNFMSGWIFLAVIFIAPFFITLKLSLPVGVIILIVELIRGKKKGYKTSRAFLTFGGFVIINILVTFVFSIVLSFVFMSLPYDIRQYLSELSHWIIGLM